MGSALGRILPRTPVAATTASLRYEQDAAERLFTLCASAGSDETSVQLVAEDGTLLDPRAAMFHRLRQTMAENGVTLIGDLPSDALRDVAFTAQSVLLRDEHFEDFLLKHPAGDQQRARSLRTDWIDRLTAFAEADEAREEDQSDVAALREIYLAEREVDLPDGVFVWMQTQRPDTWHTLAEGLDWSQPENTADMLDVVAWIAMQPACDRGTALGLLAGGISQGIFEEGHGYIDPEMGRALLDLIHERLIAGAYPNARFAPPTALSGPIQRLLSAVPGESGWSRYALAPQVLEPLGTDRAKTDIVFIAGQPCLSFEAWRAQEGV